ncbi:MAG: phosphoglucomutase/phosphomannomutase family protein [Endomicrobiales bacterium]
MITFGTSGWRGIIADDFTFDNVRLVTQAIANYVNTVADEQKRKQCTVIVGYDTRFLSERFAELSAEVLAGNGIKTLLCDRDTPTPVISYEIIRRKIDGGINFTASHNPPQYNGLKFTPAWGGPALPATTKSIEAFCARTPRPDIKSMPLDQAKKQKLVEYFNPRPLYLKRIKELINLKIIKKRNCKIATDLLNGTATGYLDELLRSAGIRQIITRNWRDVLFGGNAPEPSQDNLKSLVSIMKKESCHLGLATDGDADRFGILDSDGAFINPNMTIALLLYHLVKTRKWKGIVVRSVMTTHLIDKIAAKFGVAVKETPVGFKYIGDIMVNNPADFIIGGEESGGLTIRGHVPEKDGILACLLVAEMVAMAGKPIKGILEDIEKMVGVVVSDRLNMHLAPEVVDAVRKKMAGKKPASIGSFTVSKIVEIDGCKFIFTDGSWMGIRMSGTEPVVRLYFETDSPAKMKKLIAAGKHYIIA